MSVFLKKKESFLHEIFSKEVREPCVKEGGDTIHWFVGRRTANTRVFDISLQPYVVVYLLWHYLLPMASRCYGLFCAFSLSTFSLFALSAHA